MNQKGQPNSNQLKQLKSQSESAASACVRGVALQSVKSMHLLRCWAGEASTRGCATVCAQLRCVAHNLVKLLTRRFVSGTGSIQTVGHVQALG
jgi:hypothetical protein